ncbi:hypothetical protein FA95DRAFT_1520219 [Auriscalpium vulgare]|uniref:Uncharacterized protein n=1 Tax=Auriscalpium vulgare TaxID=40419 RepID=A0ACB8RRG3_9AGAM|nr:hypothetical protein FA95DRAFT_1520219 [Auriscalpium vulgare]
MHVGRSNNKVMYELKGIIYFGHAHFTTHIIGDSAETWFHDGITTGIVCISEEKFNAISDIYQTRGYKASVLIYSIVYKNATVPTLAS